MAATTASFGTVADNLFRVIAHFQGIALVAFLPARFLAAFFALAFWLDEFV
ncbi:MAG: hypothetical protein SVV67_11110 [Bacillota bacterium]|nr:hypothetical protein [Bacillota bacterium]